MILAFYAHGVKSHSSVTGWEETKLIFVLIMIVHLKACGQGASTNSVTYQTPLMLICNIPVRTKQNVQHALISEIQVEIIDAHGVNRIFRVNPNATI